LLSSLSHTTWLRVSHTRIGAWNKIRSFFFPLFTGVRGETVWKIAEGVSPRLSGGKRRPNRDSFEPSWPLLEPRFRTYPEFPNNFGRYSRKLNFRFTEFSDVQRNPGPIPMGVLPSDRDNAAIQPRSLTSHTSRSEAWVRRVAPAIARCEYTDRWLTERGRVCSSRICTYRCGRRRFS
jgi:hypothetical protein